MFYRMVLSHGNYTIMNFLKVSSLFKFDKPGHFDCFILLNLFQMKFCLNKFIYLFIFDQGLLQDKQSCVINMVKCCDKGRNYIHQIKKKKKSCANLWSVARSMTKYLLHGRTCHIAELLHSASPRVLIHTRATILQCRMPSPEDTMQ